MVRRMQEPVLKIKIEHGHEMQKHFLQTVKNSQSEKNLTTKPGIKSYTSWLVANEVTTEKSVRNLKFFKKNSLGQGLKNSYSKRWFVWWESADVLNHGEIAN